ncbi:MAG: lysozyme inhibitor LprI family protein [Hyphomonadaceae bacterium]
MRAIIASLLLLAACATPPAATAETATPAAVPIAACLAQAGADPGARGDCIGRGAQWCAENTEGGETTFGMVQCAMAEREQWQTIRAQQIAALRAQETPSQTALLEAALEAHERWSQARCAYEASAFEGGTLARVAGAACMNEAMAEDALRLYARNHDE